MDVAFGKEGLVACGTSDGVSGCEPDCEALLAENVGAGADENWCLRRGLCVGVAAVRSGVDMACICVIAYGEARQTAVVELWQ
jgi:hypothetical protein